MSTTSNPMEPFVSESLVVLEELFVTVHGYMLDSGESHFPTLEQITAEQAAQRRFPGTACIAAHVDHIAFYIHVLLDHVEGADWSQSWAIERVTDDEWTTLKSNLTAAYDRMRSDIQSRSVWDGDAIGMVLALIGHSGFHLGQIREAMAAFR